MTDLHAEIWELTQRLPEGALRTACERAITVPCEHPRRRYDSPYQATCMDCGVTWNDKVAVNFSDLPRGRIVRPQPGVMACPAMPHDPGPTAAPCIKCGGSGTVPDPLEAGVVARLEACGRFMPVLDLIWKSDYGEEPTSADMKLLGIANNLQMALQVSDYHGALAAALEAARALASQEQEA